MKKYILAVCAIGLMVSGCGGATSGSTSTSSSSLSTIDQLPKATDRVVSETSSNLAKSLYKAASNGMSLGSTTNSSFDSTNSRAACEVFNMTKTAVKGATNGDLILCYVQNIFEAAVANGMTDQSGNPIDIYDGNTHAFDLDLSSFSEGEGDNGGGPDHVRFQIIRNSNNVITTFKMWSCSSGEQGEYINQTIDGSDFTMVSKSVYENENGRDGSVTEYSQVDLTGTLNGDNQFVGTKNVNMKYNVPDNRWGVMLFEQSSTSGIMSAYENGTFSSGEGDVSITNRLYSDMQLLDANTEGSTYQIGLLALGDGAIYGSFSGTGDFGSFNDTVEEAWNGDSKNVESSNDHSANVSASDLPSSSEPTIAFDSSNGEDYDCSDTAEATIVLSDLDVDLNDSCSALQLSHTWIDCWNIMGEE